MKSSSFVFARVVALALLACSIGRAPAQSLYDPAKFQSLMSDHKAHRVDDVLTILIQESAAATSRTDTQTDRKSDVGVHVKWPFNQYSTAHVVGSHAGMFGTSSDFNGGGQTNRSGRLNAQMTVRVTRVLDNGMLVVHGEQVVDINDEQQQIVVDGNVRPQDISDQNVVASFRLSDAHISYRGKGDVNDVSRTSWWLRLLNAFGL